MNEKEKKALKYFYNLRATIDESNMLFDEEINVKHGKETIKQITIILNLIEKLQEKLKLMDDYNYWIQLAIDRRLELEKLYKENEELKKFITEGITVVPHSPYKNYRLDFLRENFVSKKKIKDKIEELSKTKGDLATHIAVSERIRALQEILEESEDSKDGEN